MAGVPLQRSVEPRNNLRPNIGVLTSNRIGDKALDGEGTDCLGVAAAPGYRKPWIAFARQEFTRSGLMSVPII